MRRTEFGPCPVTARIARNAQLRTACGLHRGVPRFRSSEAAAPAAQLRSASCGPLIDESALVAAVRAGEIIAPLDVYDKEPSQQDHPLRASGNTVLTPRIGYGLEETWRDFYPAQHRECSRLPGWRSNQSFERFLNVSTC
jgi:hypothetical protein